MFTRTKAAWKNLVLQWRLLRIEMAFGNILNLYHKVDAETELFGKLNVLIQEHYKIYFRK